MKVQNIKIEKLVPYENNPRNNDGAVEYVMNSIKQFGFKVPIVIDKNNVIVAGHTRYRASMELGLTEVPCIVADDLTPEQIKAFRLADNKTAEKASWDYTKLGKEIEDLQDIDLGFDLTDIGFGEFELTALTSDFEPEGFDEEDTEGYEEIGETLLARKRVIITYDAEDEDKVKELLGLDEIKNVTYDISDLVSDDKQKGEEEKGEV